MRNIIPAKNFSMVIKLTTAEMYRYSYSNRIGKKGMNKERWEKILKSSGRCYRALLENLCCSSSADLKHLKKLGIAKNGSSGETILEAIPSKRFYLPNLKAIKTFKDVRRIKEDDKIWLSM